MLHILLSPTDGGTAWRHLLAPGEARTGFEPTGPLGLVRRLGRILGIPGEAAGAPERLASFTQRLDQHDDGSRSYSASRKKDPFGVARYLLSLRDDLRLSGWDGRALDGSARLRDLSALEQVALPLPPGLPDVVADLIAGLKGAGALPFPVTVALTCPRRAFPPLFRSLLDAVAAAGATVVEPGMPEATANASTDLGRLQRALLDAECTPAETRGGRLLPPPRGRHAARGSRAHCLLRPHPDARRCHLRRGGRRRHPRHRARTPGPSHARARLVLAPAPAPSGAAAAAGPRLQAAGSVPRRRAAAPAGRSRSPDTRGASCSARSTRCRGSGARGGSRPSTRPRSTRRAAAWSAERRRQPPRRPVPPCGCGSRPGSAASSSTRSRASRRRRPLSSAPPWPPGPEVG